MALIKCSECGRTVSDKASACVGCGAPLGQVAGFTIAPAPATPFKPLSFRQLAWRAVAAAGTFVVGIVWASASDHRFGGNRYGATVAALLIIGGLCWCIVTAVQGWSSLRK